MKQLFLVIGAAILLAATWAAARRILPSSIEYQGQKIKLTRFYLDYGEYKNDPDNIDPSEDARVQRLVSGAPMAHSFANRMEASHAVFQVKFPGYGVGGFGGAIQKNDGSLNGFLVEIPRTDKARYFIFRNVHGSYVLVDDFIDSAASEIRTVHEENGKLVYCTDSGAPAFVHPIMNSK